MPLNTPSASFEQTKPFALAVAKLLEQQHPDLVVSNMRRELREGRVLVDWSQNDDMKTTICVYSLRARPRPTVSTPVTWEEVEATADGGDPSTLVFEWPQVLQRIESHGDLFEPVLKQTPAAARTRPPDNLMFGTDALWEAPSTWGLKPV